MSHDIHEVGLVIRRGLLTGLIQIEGDTHIMAMGQWMRGMRVDHGDRDQIMHVH